MSTTNNYTNRRKTFHFSKNNEDLLQYLNSKNTKEQSTFVMRLIREEMERERGNDDLAPLKAQLDRALDEIAQLKLLLANKSMEQQSVTDDELINKLFMMMADVKRETNQNFEELKNKLNHVQISDSSVMIQEESQVLTEVIENFTEEEYDDFLEDIDFF